MQRATTPRAKTNPTKCLLAQYRNVTEYIGFATIHMNI